jgi:signal transduction histidine kinase
VLTRLNDASFVRISVSDRGQGIPADFADQLFQPFFTTKPEGMGLGLSICRSIVEFHGGTLWAAANPDAGSTFHFTLPVCE